MAPGRLPGEVFLDMSIWEELLGQTQNTLESPDLSAGVGPAQDPPEGAGRGGLRWSFCDKTVGPGTQTQINGGRWI